MYLSISPFHIVVAALSAVSFVTPFRLSPYFDHLFNQDLLSSKTTEYRDTEGICYPDCDSQIFCQGELLHDVQLLPLRSDSKYFVDLKLKYSENEIVRKYKALKSQFGPLSKIQMDLFIDENFQVNDLDPWMPPDFNENPSVLDNIGDNAYKSFARNLNEIWKDLAVKVDIDVLNNPDRYSMLYLPNGFIKAGGRFREMYYWDSYWIIRGLLLCDMYDTARGMIENIISLVKKYGHMPNGSRKYYLQRSQPPLLIQMAATYHSVTKNDSFIRENLQYFDREFQFWLENRMVEVHKNGRIYHMARYNATSCSPRPESYREDFSNSKSFTTEAERKKFFTAIKSGAESGWDFSSRHIRGPGDSNKGNLSNLDTQSFVYVDLNCILHANAVVLSEWHRYFKEDIKAQYYKKIAEELFRGIENVLWNEEAGIWLDWDLKAKRSRNYFYPSNLTPLWTGSYTKKVGLVEKIVVYLVKNNIVGTDLSPKYWAVPASLENTKEQWDFPNGWAPLQAIVMQGLERTYHPLARYIAFRMAQNWIDTTYTGFSTSLTMFEKYSATEKGSTGGGGEYTPQTGFGWTNGFVLEVLNTWGKYLNSKRQL